LMTRLTNDIDALNEMFTSGAISILGDVLTILGITILLLIINWQLGIGDVRCNAAALLDSFLFPCRYAR